MNVPASVKAEWEKRFPELSGKWTHWQIVGDRTPIACFPGERGFDAMRFVEANCMSYSSIKCHLAIADEKGQCSEIDPTVFEISNIRKDQLEHHSVSSRRVNDA